MQGDGLRRYLNIVAASANPMNNILLIDEIENGLHYSAYKKLWEAIFALATTTNKQVFVTTHSKETLSHLNEMLEEHPDTVFKVFHHSIFFQVSFSRSRSLSR